MKWIKVGPNPVTGVLIGRGKFGIQIHREDHLVKMEVEIRVTLPGKKKKKNECL